MLLLSNVLVFTMKDELNVNWCINVFKRCFIVTFVFAMSLRSCGVSLIQSVLIKRQNNMNGS